MEVFVLIGGWPGSGKTTLASLGVGPLIEVDTTNTVDVRRLATRIQEELEACGA